jgi:hypothetical protein
MHAEWNDQRETEPAVMPFGCTGYEIFLRATPKIEATATDPADPFSFPFSLTNESTWFTFYSPAVAVGERVSCGPGVHVQNNTLIVQLENVPPGRPSVFSVSPLKFGIEPRTTPPPTSVMFRISAEYDIKLCGLWPHHCRYRSNLFTWWFGSDGKPSWVETSSADGDDLGADIDAVKAATAGVEKLP